MHTRPLSNLPTVRLCSLLIIAVAFAKAAPAQDSSNEPIIHSETYNFKTPDEYRRRNDTETEAASVLVPPSVAEVNPIKELFLRLQDDQWRDWDELMECEPCESFTAGYPVEDMPWDQKSHERRQRLNPLWLTIEPERFESDNNGRKLDVATDLFDDWYLDTSDFLLLDKTKTVLRARRRWRSEDPRDEPEVRRVLIQRKVAVGIDDLGQKQSEKLDIRYGPDDDKPDEMTASVVADAISGFVPWPWEGATRGSKTPAEPVKAAYEALAELDVLPDIGGHKDVLQLERRAFIRSVRGRYHLREVPVSTIETSFYWRGFGLLTEVEMLASERLEGSADNKTESTDLKDLIAAVRELKFRRGEFGSWMRPNADDVAALNDLRATAASLKASFFECASQVKRFAYRVNDDVSRDRRVEQFDDWARVDQEQTIRRIYDRVTGGDPHVVLDQFNDYGNRQRIRRDNELFDDFSEWSSADFDAFKSRVLAIHLHEIARQLEAAGAAAEGIWFDFALSTALESYRRPESDLVIDTMDLSAYYTPDAWNDLKDAEQTSARMPDVSKILGATLVSEVQLELRRMEALNGRISTLEERAESGEDVAELLNLATYVRDTYLAALTTVSELREEWLQDVSKKFKIKGCEWEPAEESKGRRALELVRNAEAGQR